jgi:uncharacterized SAM-binding protein YcdF (DUF218 family)
MAGFLYSLLLRMLSPTSVALILLLAVPFLRRRRILRRVCFGLALAVLLIGGNGWVVRYMVERLEQQHRAADPTPHADAILILSGGIHAQRPPRRTVEVSEAGDRVLYGAELYRRGHAPRVVCTGNVGTGGIALRSEAEDMADLLAAVGVPRSAIVLETQAQNTREHAVNLCPMFAERQIRRVLLVTTAMHMPRSIGVFRRGCPSVEYIAAPTDFRVTERLPEPWYRQIGAFIPTPGAYVGFTEATHEYIGMAYYRLRGWM